MRKEVTAALEGVPSKVLPGKYIINFKPKGNESFSLKSGVK